MNKTTSAKLMDKQLLLSNVPLLRVVEVKKSFVIREQVVPVLTRVNFEVKSGEMVAITGASGSGKSTLLNLLAGIDTPTQGEVYFLGHALGKLTESKLAVLRCHHIGFVFQQHNLIKELTVWENTLLPAMIQPMFHSKKKEKTKLALALLNKIGLSHRLGHYVGELSGGEAQRVAIVRAFINNPKLVFADEPTGNLDKQNSFDVFSLLRFFAKTHSTAVVMVTHSLELSNKCDSVYSIMNGVLQGTFDKEVSTPSKKFHRKNTL